jgi:hypothetical protein
MQQQQQQHCVNDINNPSPMTLGRMPSRHGSLAGSPPLPPHIPHMAQMTNINDSSE